MNAQVVEKYREIRKDHVARWSGSGAIYHHKVSAKQALQSARRHVEIINAWEDAKEQGKVRLKIEPDLNYDLEWLLGDSYNPDVVDLSPETLERQKQKEIDRINREGVYGIVGEYKCSCCGSWIQADSVWGFVGDDWKESGYDLDVMSETLSAAGL